MSVRRALFLCLLALLVAAPAADAAKRKVPRGFFGVMWDRDASNSEDSAQEQQWSLMSSSGVESVRTVFSWARAQRDPGAISFAHTDALVARAARHHQRVLPVVLWAPDWARLYPEKTSSPPAREDDYTAYLTALVGRYGPDGTFWSEHPELPRVPIREWQIWNEPELAFYWNVPRDWTAAWPKGYVKLLKASRKAIKSRDRSGKLVLGGLSETP